MDAFTIKPPGDTFGRYRQTEGRIMLGSSRLRVVCPFAFVIVRSRDAEPTIAALRLREPMKTPILIGAPPDAADMLDIIEDDEQDAGDWLAMAAGVDLDEWYAMRVAYWRGLQEQLGGVIPPRGAWRHTPTSLPDDPAGTSFLSRAADDGRVVIVLLATNAPAEAPAFLSFGRGLDDCPLPSVLVALCRDWQQRFGAVPVTLTDGLMEFQVARPPTTRAAAERLALEHFHACPASVGDTLQARAAQLIDAVVWRLQWL
jgi:hypothetical protein